MNESNFEWFRSLRTFLYDAYWPPFHPQLDYDPKKAISTAREMEANAIRFGSIGKWALYQSNVMPLHPDLNGRDLLAETVEEAKKAGVKVIAYVPVGHGLPKSLIEHERPAWSYVLDDGKLPPGSRHFAGPEVGPVCTFGPYREDILKILREVVSYDVDGLYIDGPYQGWIFNDSICQCPACKRLFKKRSGMELPTNAGFKAPSLAAQEIRAAHAAFVADGLAALLEQIRKIASARKLPLLFNSCAMEYLGAERQSGLAKLADGFLIESSMGASRASAMGFAMTRSSGTIRDATPAGREQAKPKMRPSTASLLCSPPPKEPRR